MNSFRYAFRQVGRRPGFSAVIVVMLALGIGATTAMFSVFHQVLLQPLPVSEPGQLVNLGAPGPKPGSTSCGGAGDCEQVFSYPMFRDLEARQTVFTGIAAHREFRANFSFRGQTLAGPALLVSGAYFRVLNLQPGIGRLITEQDEPQIGESAVAVLSHQYWQNQFNADPAVVGQTLIVNGQPLTVIGVAAAGFSGTTTGQRPNVFVPLSLRWLMEPTAQRDNDNRLSYWTYLFARLKPGVTVEQASTGINSIYSAVLNEVEVPLNGFLPAAMLERFRHRQITVEPGARGQSSVPDDASQPLALLLGLTTLVLLIVCVNIANLLLARGASRAGEMAIRASIGATRGRLVSQLLAEAAVLAIIGGAVSLPIAALTLKVIVAMIPAEFANNLAIALSPTAALFAAAVSMSTVLLFGLVPALQATRADPGRVVKGQAPQAGGRGMVRFRAALATAQIAFSLVLLVMAGLFAKSLVNIARVDLGIDVDSLATFSVSPRLNGYSAEQTTNVYERIEAALAAQPGVISVGSSLVPMIAGSDWSDGLNVEGFERGPGIDSSSSNNQVNSGFFRTLGIPLLAGRDFTDADALNTPRVAIVNESFLRKFALGNDALGKRFGIGGGDNRDIEIVGVVADAKYSDVKGDTPPQHFLPWRQNANIGFLSFYVRAAVAPDVLLTMIPGVVKGIDPDLPVNNPVTMRLVVQNRVFLDRFLAMLSAGFAALATLLAAIGLYGVLAYGVTQRTRELGLRLALGATPAALRIIVFRQLGWMALIGMPVGIAAAVGLGNAAQAMLFGLSGYDPVVLLAAVTVLSAVVTVAGYVPARRAARVAPMEALRYE